MYEALDLFNKGIWLGAAVLALLKGDKVERAAGLALLFTFLLVQLLRDRAPPGQGEALVFFTDLALGVILALVAWRSRRSWPVWATAFQSIALAVDVSHATDLQLSWMAYAAAANVSANGVAVTLAVGTWIAWREREALDDFGIDARRI